MMFNVLKEKETEIVMRFKNAQSGCYNLLKFIDREKIDTGIIEKSVIELKSFRK